MSEGIKYDQGKPRLAEMIIDFAPELEELCKVWEFGANKYGKSNWKEVENGYERYSNALVRHLAAENNRWYDDESELLHAAHIAFNALARIHFILQDKLHRVKPLGIESAPTCDFYYLGTKLPKEKLDALLKEVKEGIEK